MSIVFWKEVLKLNEIINLFESNSLEKQVFIEIFKCNEFTLEYGLMLQEEDVKEIIKQEM